MNEIEETIKSGKAHLVSSDRLRRMFYDKSDVWEVWGQRYKYDRTHCIVKGSLEKCLSVLIGESSASMVANKPPLMANG